MSTYRGDLQLSHSAHRAWPRNPARQSRARGWRGASNCGRADITASVTFALFEAAYCCEIFHTGLRSVPKGQYEAANKLVQISGRLTQCFLDMRQGEDLVICCPLRLIRAGRVEPIERIAHRRGQAKAQSIDTPVATNRKNLGE